MQISLLQKLASFFEKFQPIHLEMFKKLCINKRIIPIYITNNYGKYSSINLGKVTEKFRDKLLYIYDMTIH